MTPPKLNSDLASATPQDDPDALAALCWEACGRIEDLEKEVEELKDELEHLRSQPSVRFARVWGAGHGRP